MLIGGVLGTIIELTFVAIKTYINNKINAARKRKLTRKASANIRKTNKNINEDIEKLNSLRIKLMSEPKMVVANYNLCKLISVASNNYIGFEVCENFYAAQYSLLSEIRCIEKRVYELANEYDKIGNIKQAGFYRSIANG